MLRRLHPEQPDSFAFTPANQAWAEAQMTKYPPGRQASAIIPLLWRAQEQEGWLTRAAIESVAEMLDLAYIRALEVATFYFMFQLQPVGSVAHFQICGTTSCMICGAEDLIAVCKDKIAPHAHQVSQDGKFSWEEVECLGACANAPMAQIGKDYYEDLTAEGFAGLIDAFGRGEVPVPGPQNGRYASEPASGLTSLTEHSEGRIERNASVGLAHDLSDTVKRIDGTEVPLVTPWADSGVEAGSPPPQRREEPVETPGPRPSHDQPANKTGITEQEAEGASRGKPRSAQDPAGEGADEDRTETSGTGSGPGASGTTGSGAGKDTGAAPGAADGPERQPETLDAPRGGTADDLKKISGVGPQLEGILNDMGIYHFDQIAAWGEDEITWVDNRLRFKGRIRRDDWIAQARELADKS